MKIRFQNLGQIKDATFDLSKDLTVFCGANNSGKTYAAYGIYGLFEFIANPNNTAFFMSKDPAPLPSNNLLVDMQDFFRLHMSRSIEEILNQYKNTLSAVFAAPDDFFKNTHINISQFDEKEILKKIEDLDFAFDVQVNGDTKIKYIKKSQQTYVNILIENMPKDNILAPIYKSIIFGKIGEQITKLLFNKVHIAPAERIAINIFSKELSERRHDLVETLLNFKDRQNATQNTLSNILEQRASRYSLPIKNSLETAERLDVLRKQKSPFAYLADEIEKSILKGKMKVSDIGEVQFSPNKSGLNLGVHLTASVVKSLASIVFYCRHMAKAGDLLIIDEPELNLHPDNQRKIARTIAQMANAGIKILISTHSDYIIKELNNLIMLSVEGNDKNVKRLMKRYGYQDSELLRPAQVGAYLFMMNGEVTNLEVSATGFEIKSIDDEINALNESSKDIFFSLHED